jgi:hypothetical protein
VHNKPAWSSQFLIACINKSGLFKTPLRYRFSGKEGTDEYGCVAWAVDNSGEILESTKITVDMAKKEGWWSKKDKQGKECSKWQTMPEQMLRYRAATFFARAYCPELTMGMMTKDEVQDAYDVEVVPMVPGKSATATKLDKALGLDKNDKQPGDSSHLAPEQVAQAEDIDADPEDDDFFEKDAAATEERIQEAHQKAETKK